MSPNKDKICCLRGHAFTPENTRVYHAPDGRVARICRRCDALRCRRAYWRDKRARAQAAT